MRDVIFFEMRRNAETKRYEKVEAGKAKFHQFGVGYEEFESGPGNFSTAIIEKEDGSIENIFVEMVRFVS